MQILIASNNEHKLIEYRQIFGQRVITPEALGISFEVAETGATFVENALLKAEAVLALIPHESRASYAVLADDSGICIDALDGRPGLYSARYGSPDGGRTELSAAERNRLVLRELEGIQDRNAHFICTIALLLPGDRRIIVQEAWHGLIADSESAGTHGFGYDPIFVVPSEGITASELSPDKKNRLSHRGRASRVVREALARAEALPR